jgi:hypothetical protein
VEKAKPAAPAATAATSTATDQMSPRLVLEVVRPGPTAASVSESTATAAQVQVTIRGEESGDTRTSDEADTGTGSVERKMPTGITGQEQSEVLGKISFRCFKAFRERTARRRLCRIGAPEYYRA